MTTHVLTEQSFRDWIEQSSPGDQVVYSLNRDHPSLIATARVLHECGCVHLTQRRAAVRADGVVVYEYLATRASPEYEERQRRRRTERLLGSRSFV